MLSKKTGRNPHRVNKQMYLNIQASFLMTLITVAQLRHADVCCSVYGDGTDG